MSEAKPSRMVGGRFIEPDLLPAEALYGAKEGSTPLWIAPNETKVRCGVNDDVHVIVRKEALFRNSFVLLHKDCEKCRFYGIIIGFLTKQKMTFTPIPPPPRIPTGKEIYDSIMGEIEPELLSDNLPKLKEQYPDETPEQKKVRAALYNKAFAEYDKKFSLYMAELHGQVTHYRKQAVADLETRDRTEEQSKMQAMESFFDAA